MCLPDRQTDRHGIDGRKQRMILLRCNLTRQSIRLVTTVISYHITFAISLQSSIHDPLGRRHWSLSFTHKLSRVSKSLTALFGMRHLTYGTNFLHLFAFLVSRPPQSTLLHCQAPTLLLSRWLACLTGSSILVLKLTFSPDPFPRNLPLSLTD